MYKLLVLLALSFSLLIPQLEADDSQPSILSLNGYSKQLGRQVEARLSYRDLVQLPQVTVVTQIHWTKGDVKFSGPLLRDVIASVKLSGSQLKATAANDYSVNIPFADFESHNVILALKREDKRLTLRTKGPIWVIYPWNDTAELRQGIYYSRSIWQLVELTSYE